MSQTYPSLFNNCGDDDGPLILMLIIETKSRIMIWVRNERLVTTPPPVTVFQTPRGQKIGLAYTFNAVLGYGAGPHVHCFPRPLYIFLLLSSFQQHDKWSLT